MTRIQLTLRQRVCHTTRAGFAALLFCLGLNAQAQVVYYHNDVSGSPLAATDETGNLLWRESYRPYGDRILKPATTNKQWFHGKPLDPDTGMEDFGARNYDPILGRFLSIDPVDFLPDNVHSFNRYGYANNNPLRYKDPDGRVPLLLIPVAIDVAIIAATRAAVFIASAAVVAHAANQATQGSAPAAPTTATPGPATPTGDGGTRPSTLSPGPNAGDSVPARGPGRDFTPSERDKVNGIGNATGCHTCGAPTPGTKSGNWVPDHQPPTSQNPTGGQQRLYPHCLKCSRTQGGEARQAPKPPPKKEEQR